MFGWFKKRQATAGDGWLNAEQSPGDPFPLPKGAVLKPSEEVVLAVPKEIVGEQEEIGSVLFCDDDAQISLNEKAGVWMVMLRPEMELSLSKSCELLVVAEDKRPRKFRVRRP